MGFLVFLKGWGGGGGGVVRSEHQVNIGSMIGYLLGIELVFQNKIIRV